MKTVIGLEVVSRGRLTRDAKRQGVGRERLPARYISPNGIATLATQSVKSHIGLAKVFDCLSQRRTVS
jgi:hypothetical protein